MLPTPLKVSYFCRFLKQKIFKIKFIYQNDFIHFYTAVEVATLFTSSTFRKCHSPIFFKKTLIAGRPM